MHSMPFLLARVVQLNPCKQSATHKRLCSFYNLEGQHNILSSRSKYGSTLKGRQKVYLTMFFIRTVSIFRTMSLIWIITHGTLADLWPCRWWPNPDGAKDLPEVWPLLLCVNALVCEWNVNAFVSECEWNALVCECSCGWMWMLLCVNALVCEWKKLDPQNMEARM